MHHYSWYNPAVRGEAQKWLNRYFTFKESGPAKCILHDITRCQQCTAQAFRHLGDK